MTLIFKRNFSKRSNPYRKRVTLSENDQGENNGRNKSLMKKEGKENLTKKKRLREDSDGMDENHMSADEKLSKLIFSRVKMRIYKIVTKNLKGIRLM